MYEGILNPFKVYGGMPGFQQALRLLKEDMFLLNKFLLYVVTVKLADRIAGWSEYDYFRDSDFALPIDPKDAAAVRKRETLNNLPDKIFQKTIQSMNVRLVNRLEGVEYRRIVEIYYGELIRIVMAHLAIDLVQFPQAGPLVGAARNAIPGLKKNIRDQTLIFNKHPLLSQLSA